MDYQVLRDAVEADEPLIGYDDMDQEAKDLVRVSRTASSCSACWNINASYTPNILLF